MAILLALKIIKKRVIEEEIDNNAIPISGYSNTTNFPSTNDRRVIGRGEIQ